MSLSPSSLLLLLWSTHLFRGKRHRFKKLLFSFLLLFAFFYWVREKVKMAERKEEREMGQKGNKEVWGQES